MLLHLLPVAIAVLACPAFPQDGALDLSALPILKNTSLGPIEKDWLVDTAGSPAGVFRNQEGTELILDNGLVRRTLRLTPNAATVAFDNLMTGQAILRSVRPEARITLNGVQFTLGGLQGQPNHAFLNDSWVDAMTAIPQAWRCVGFEVSEPKKRLEWKQLRHHAPNMNWPPKGVSLRLDFAADSYDRDWLIENWEAQTAGPVDDEKKAAGLQRLERALPYLRVSVHYDLFDNVPLYSKWVTIHNGSKEVLRVDDFTLDILAAVERESVVETRTEAMPPPLLRVETEYSMGGLSFKNSRNHGFRWLTDPLYTSQVSYERSTPCLLEVGPANKALRPLDPGKSFSTYRDFVLPYDSEDITRRALSDARVYETIAPWVTENPLMMHVRYADPASVKLAIDQCVETGFEIVIMTFGSGFNIEDRSESNLERITNYVNYGAERGIEVGGYSLLSSRRINPPGDNCINPATGSPGGAGMIHGGTPALASGWGQRYLETVKSFYASTGALNFEHDGPYPGNLDASHRPPLQNGVEDSRYVNWMLSADLYRDLRARGVYINAPDWYYLVGTSKCGMGYREVNWSLPRKQQLIHTRQNIFDGTRYKLPSMGWMFVPLTQYQGGGAAATVEPLSEHLDHYEGMLASNLGAGVQACYRGPRLYDTERVRDAVLGWVTWFKQHRDILESPIVHSASRRADGRDLDWFMHANPRLDEKGLLMVYNPTQTPLERNLMIDLRYTGLRGQCLVRREGAPNEVRPLDGEHRINIQVDIPPNGHAWLVFGAP